MSASARQWLERIQKLAIPEQIKIMNVCGGHERAITQAGIRSLLPSNIELIPGPGCPVCICPEEDIYQAIQLALHEDITLVAFGDMLRVPVNTKSQARTLLEAQAQGADIRAIASPTEAVAIAHQQADKAVIFFAAGFETTTAPVAGMIAQGMPDNLFLLLSARLTWPAVAMLLDSEAAGFDALVAPGHVSAVMGPEDWDFVVEQHRIPTAVAGFTAETILAATYSVLRQKIENKIFLDNCYSSVVKKGGNPTAKQQLASTMDIVDANWRGVGVIAKSGFELKDTYKHHNARLHYPSYDEDARQRAGQMPPGCDCARVVLGKIYPNQCRLYGTGCTPGNPVGPCMVSDEGACRIWWSGGIREQAR